MDNTLFPSQPPWEPSMWEDQTSVMLEPVGQDHRHGISHLLFNCCNYRWSFLFLAVVPDSLLLQPLFQVSSFTLGNLEKCSQSWLPTSSSARVNEIHSTCVARAIRIHSFPHQFWQCKCCGTLRCQNDIELTPKLLDITAHSKLPHHLRLMSEKHVQLIFIPFVKPFYNCS